MEKLAINVLFIFCIGCSLTDKKETYVYPPTNPYPSIFTEVETQLSTPNLSVEVYAKSLEISCLLRNDSPYYWCFIDGKIINKDKNLPKKVATFFHTVVDESGMEKSKKLVQRMKKNGIPVTMILNIGIYINKEAGELSAQLIGLFNKKECMNLFGDYSVCPSTSKINRL